ncbi:MAG: methyltransferase domain-containing protein [Alphaproteobacteria bacterium]|nr:methyltransferase domain-containing protein [Alphaproteobacteria bacterium]
MNHASPKHAPVACPVTGQSADFYCRKEQADYFVNRQDGIIFLGTMPDIKAMSEYANSNYEAGAYRDYVQAKPLKLLTANIRLDQIAWLNPGKTLLDVGCSAGFFLEAAQKRQYEVQGVEFAAAAIAQADPSVRAKIIHGDVHKEISRWENNFDVVSAFDIIEHTHDPAKFVADIKNMLKPDGLLVMSTPDTGHFLRHLMGARWSMLQPLQHTVLFSRKAMRDMLEKSGFKNIEISATYKYLTFEYLAVQLKETNRLMANIMGNILKIMPKKLAQHPFRINIGEFIVFARKA